MRIASIVAVSLALVSSLSHAWEKKPTAAMSEEEIATLRIDDGVTGDTLKQVRKAIEDATKKDSKVKVLKVFLFSPGGDAFAGFEAARQLRKLSDAGKVTVEMHAEGLCASACTVILAAGTPGQRYIATSTFFLVHPVQRGNMFGVACVERVDNPKTQDEKTGNVILEVFRDLYMRFTGKGQKTVEEWLSCGHEKVGNGSLAVSMGIADQTED